MEQDRPREEPSVSALLLRLRHETAELVASELALVRAEARHRGRELRRGLGPALIGAGVIGAGLTALLAALVVGVAGLLGNDYALSALLVGITALVAGGALVAIGGRTLGRALEIPEEIHHKRAALPAPHNGELRP